MLQFIIDKDSGFSPAEQVFAAIEGGCRWVQIKMKESSDEEITKLVEEIKPKCIETETFLLLEDRVELAKTLDVGGVYLNKGGMLPSKARMILGPAAVIGVSVNTIEDIIAVRSLDVDFVCMEPYSDKTEKGEDANVLGTDDIKDLCAKMEEKEINIGHVAGGNVRLEDVAPLMEVGVNGIAVSRAIADAGDIKEATRKFLDALKPYMKADGMKTIE